MPLTTLSATLARVCRPVAPQPTDGALVAAFVASRDEAAFAELVKRHGPMVLAVCQRITGHIQDAEDAFQATFLVLARRAADVRPAEQVGNWLYGVAVRTARAARVAAARRLAREAPTHPLPEVGSGETTPLPEDVRAVLDEELVRLPNKFRALLVACDLGGEPQTAVARRLGLPVGTIYSRLSRAREALAGRLTARGIVFPASAFATIGLPLAVPASVTRLAEQLPRKACIPTIVAQLTNGVIRTMRLNTFTRLTAGLFAVAVIGVGMAGMVFHRVHAGDTLTPPDSPPSPTPTATGKDNVKPVRVARIMYTSDGELRSMDADGTHDHKVDLPPDEGAGAVLSPDARSIAYWVAVANTKPDAIVSRVVVCIRQLDGKKEVTRFDIPFEAGFIEFCWAPDGSELIVNTGAPGAKGVSHVRLDVKTKKVSPMNVLGTDLITDWTPDGKRLLTTPVGTGAEWEPKGIYLMNLDGTESAVVADPKTGAFAGRISPDGSRVLCHRENQLWVVEVDKPDSLAKVEGILEKAEVTSFAWAPDGKRIVYTTGTFRLTNPDDLAEVESKVVVADPDGKNAKTLRTAKGKLYGGVDWK